MLITAVLQIFIYLFFSIMIYTEYSSFCYTVGPCLSIQKLTFANHRLVQCLDRLSWGGGWLEHVLKLCTINTCLISLKMCRILSFHLKYLYILLPYDESLICQLY